MFAKNAAAGAGGVKRKTVDGGAPLPTAVDADSLLEDILAGVGATDVPAAPPSSFRAVPRAPPVNQFRRSAPSQPPPSVAATLVTVMKPAATTPVAPRAAPTSVAKGVTWPENVEHVKKTADDDYFIPPPLSPPSSQRGDDDAPLPHMDNDAMDEDDEPPSPGAAAAAAKKSSPPGILKPTTEPADVSAAPARVVTAAGVAAGTKLAAAPSASDAYAAMMTNDDEGNVTEDVAPATIADGSLPLDVDDSLPFYLLDAHEDINSPGKVFLFGRVPVAASNTDGETVSACAVVSNMQRCMFVVPNPEVFADPENEISELEDAALKHARAAETNKDDLELATTAKKAKGALLRCLQGRAGDVKGEIRDMLLARGIEQFSMKPVKRSYCFERDDIPRGAQYVVKVRYPALNTPLPADLKGNHFVCVLGTQTGMLEHLMIKSRVMGPSWLALKGAVSVPQTQQASWCKLEVNLVGAHKSVRQPRAGAPNRDPPKLTVAALNLKTVVNHRQNVNEIASASVVYVRDVRADAATTAATLQDVNRVRHFSCVRRLDGVSMPPGWDQLVTHENKHNPAARRSGSVVLSSQTSERGLLSFLLARLQQLDADVIVGHNIAGFDLDVLLHRLQANKVPHWSRVGRLKRTKFPNLAGGGGAGFGGGASIGAMSCVAGRLLAGTYWAFPKSLPPCFPIQD